MDGLECGRRCMVCVTRRRVEACALGCSLRMSGAWTSPDQSCFCTGFSLPPARLRWPCEAREGGPRGLTRPALCPPPRWPVPHMLLMHAFTPQPPRALRVALLSPPPTPTPAPHPSGFPFPAGCDAGVHQRGGRGGHGGVGAPAGRADADAEPAGRSRACSVEGRPRQAPAPRGSCMQDAAGMCMRMCRWARCAGTARHGGVDIRVGAGKRDRLEHSLEHSWARFI